MKKNLVVSWRFLFLSMNVEKWIITLYPRYAVKKYAYQSVCILISPICIAKVCILFHILFNKCGTHLCQTLMIILTYTHWTSILGLQKNVTSYTTCSWNMQKSQEKKMGQTFSTPFGIHSNLYAKRPTKEGRQYGSDSCNKVHTKVFIINMLLHYIAIV